MLTAILKQLSGQILEYFSPKVNKYKLMVGTSCFITNPKWLYFATWGLDSNGVYLERWTETAKV